MTLPIMLLFVGFAFIILFGGLSLLRREGLSLRFAMEALLITGLASGLAALTGLYIHPVFFLLFLYLVTFRVRILVDLGTYFARRKDFSQAERFYRLAERLWPDRTGSLILQVNRGTTLLQSGKLDEAVDVFKTILDQKSSGYLGRKYEAATYFNLGVAYLRKGLEGQATVAFNTVIDTLPVSEYARRASQALDRQRHKDNSGSTDKNL
jgi:tetratricopeptide (TPR) repeat protein